MVLFVFVAKFYIKMRFITTLFFLSIIAFRMLANFTIAGIITNSEGKPLGGANIAIQDTYYGTFSMSDGSFYFKNLEAGQYTITTSFVGYETTRKTLTVDSDISVTIKLNRAEIIADEILISSTRAGGKAPMAYTNLHEEAIKDRNMGQDVPYLLSMTPSVVASSDAGGGVGYTSLRIRGTGVNRINVTVNGIPVNDSESHGVWWVNMPDLSSSVNNMQVQRGVGTSTNGAAAFGATINFQTYNIQKKPFAQINSSFGSFNTWKNNVRVSSGLINDRFVVDARLSKITSDGFVDRAESELKSFFVSGAYYSPKSMLRVNIFSGKEKTYQAWNGVPKVKLENDLDGIEQLIAYSGYSEQQAENLRNSNARTYNYYEYENETDNYQQDHYQLLFSHEFNENLNLNMALHYTYGRGYYEQYKEDADFEDYQLNNVVIGEETIESTDLVRQKWLDNDFYGTTFSLNYKNKKLNCSFGGAWNKYDGDHFGEIIWARYSGNSEIGYRWYESDGIKKDFNLFAKFNYQLMERLSFFADLQYRKIDYIIKGIDDDLRDIGLERDFDFFNPKVGLFYDLTSNQSFYASLAVANREPTRSNYTDANTANGMPKAETLYDYEFGYNLRKANSMLNMNIYYMDYKDQLVLTGQINDVGSPIMVNMKDSYRRGIEFSGAIKPFDNFELDGNITFSQNKIKNYTEYVDNWDYWSDPDNQVFQITKKLDETDISFSPALIASGQITYYLIDGFSIGWNAKYVGKQYIDNTSSSERMLDAYLLNNLRCKYSFNTKQINNIDINLLVNNIFNAEYESNAWVYRYYSEGKHYVMDGYFPQAGINFMAGLSITF